jgi:hypothetical protein
VTKNRQLVTFEEVSRIRRVAGIIALDARNPDNQARGREIEILAEMLERKLSGLTDDTAIV